MVVPLLVPQTSGARSDRPVTAPIARSFFISKCIKMQAKKVVVVAQVVQVIKCDCWNKTGRSHLQHFPVWADVSGDIMLSCCVGGG
jgi:hypothetical protein